MFLRFEENPNCGFAEDRLWKEQGAPRRVREVLRARDGKDVWCPVTGLAEKGAVVAALAVKVEDSGEGTCWLVYGGRWGLRLKTPENTGAWSLQDPRQWAEAFLLLPPGGQDLRWE